MASRHRIWLLPLLIALFSPFWYPALASFLSIHLTSITGHPPRAQQLQMEDVILRQYNQGRLELRLQAAGVQNDSFVPGDYHLRQVYCQLLDEQGESTTIRGGEALFSPRQQVVTIVDDVQVQGRGGKYLLTTDALRYLSQYKVFKTATPVHLQSPQADIHGGSLMYNLRSGDFRVGKRVVCQL